MDSDKGSTQATELFQSKAQFLFLLVSASRAPQWVLKMHETKAKGTKTLSKSLAGLDPKDAILEDGSGPSKYEDK